MGVGEEEFFEFVYVVVDGFMDVEVVAVVYDVGGFGDGVGQVGYVEQQGDCCGLGLLNFIGGHAICV